MGKPFIFPADGYFSPGDVTRHPESAPGISGMTPEDFNMLYDQKTNYTSPFATNLVTQAYDAIWAMALALNATENRLIEMGIL